MSIFGEPFPAQILGVVGYLRVNKEGRVARQDGGTIVCEVNETGWGEQSPIIAAMIVATWNAELTKKLTAT